MRWGAALEGVQQIPELGLRLGLGHADGVKDAHLHVAAVDAQAATCELVRALIVNVSNSIKSVDLLTTSNCSTCHKVRMRMPRCHGERGLALRQGCCGYGTNPVKNVQCERE